MLASAPPTGRSTRSTDTRAERPLAWVDDCIDATCQAWAVDRSAPTLLVSTEPDLGLTDKHLQTLLGWVRAGYTA